MRRFYILLVLLLVLLFPKADLKAQPKLGLYTTSVSNSTPNLGNQISILTKLKNQSLTDTFSGLINFSLANKDSIITSVAIVGKPNFNATIITLAPQEERAALFTVNILPSHFKVGPDIIIVWPVAAADIVDSARAPLDIKAPVGFSDDLPDDLQLYVSNEHLVINTSEDKYALQQVQIFDMTGSLVRRYPLNAKHNSIPINDLPTGVFIAEIIEPGIANRRLKFIR